MCFMFLRKNDRTSLTLIMIYLTFIRVLVFDPPRETIISSIGYRIVQIWEKLPIVKSIIMPATNFVFHRSLAFWFFHRLPTRSYWARESDLWPFRYQISKTAPLSSDNGGLHDLTPISFSDPYLLLRAAGVSSMSAEWDGVSRS